MNLSPDTVLTAVPASRASAPNADHAVLERNLAALGRASRGLAERLRAATPSRRVEFVETPEGGALSATLDGRALASKRRPLEESLRLAEAIDIKSAAVFAVMGFGLGHHVAALAKRVGRTGIVLCYEPDVGLLRAALERIDHADWLATSNIAILTDAEDAASLSAVVHGVEGLVAMGVRIVEHPASAERLGESAKTFGDTLSKVVSAVRTNVLTTMVQTETTVRNLVMNADRYIASAGIEDLRGALAGRPAVVVSAGPSLARNMHALAAPGVRDRVCIVAVQTTLKPLLAAGIRPHFVVALDHHEISRRFYDGLAAADVAGVTLVVEPKANPAILDAWPGAVRIPRDPFLDELLGDDLADANRGAIRSGATVAHLAHYLARHLGCDPVALIGQDLGFTDAQYYAAGAAIHEVWACELNEFVSLELLEWQRIVRSRGILRRVEDTLGRPIYTDEQMATYLAQFERDFLGDAGAGLRVIDATEGGVRKAHTTPMTLDAFLREFATSDLPAMHAPVPGSRPAGRDASAEPAAERLREVRQGVWRMANSCRTTASVLAQMAEHNGDRARVDRLIGEAQRLAADAASIQPAYRLVHRFNQTGVFNRARDDRAIALDDLDPYERQRRQIERDQRNMRWLEEAAEALGAVLDAGAAAMRGGPRVSGDVSAPTQRADASEDRSASVETSVAALLLVDTVFDPFGRPRDLRAQIDGVPVLRRTVERLSRCTRLDSIHLLTDDPDAVRSMLDGMARVARIEVERVSLDATRRGAGSLRGARAWAASCWRGGIGGMTIYDECLDPALFAATLERTGVRAALVVGADWAAIDPALCDEVIARHAEDPGNHRLAFTQAPPGVCGCVVDRGLLREMAQSRARGAALATIGGLLAYSPRKPRADAIAKPICVRIDAAVRDAQARFIAEDASGRALCALAPDGERPSALLAARFAQESARPMPPREGILRVQAGCSADDLVRAYDTLGRPPAVTLDARTGGAVAPLVLALRTCGAAAVHARVDARRLGGLVTDLLTVKPEVISIDMHADSAAAFAAVTGEDRFADALAALEALANGARSMDPAERPWIVPRLTKRDAVYSDLESFVDKWTTVFGHAAVDGYDDAPASERVRTLPLPQSTVARIARERRVADLRSGARR